MGKVVLCKIDPQGVEESEHMLSILFASEWPQDPYLLIFKMKRILHDDVSSLKIKVCTK